VPFADVADVRLHYRFDGPEDAPVVMLSNSLGTNVSMWDPQMPALTARYRVLRYDSRGHGQSAVTAGPYRIEQLARDAVGLLEALGLARVRFCGLSLGGMVGQWLGANASQRLTRLALCNTTAHIGAPDAYNARIDAVTRGGMAAVVDGVLARWYTADFIASAPAAVAATRAMLLTTPADGYTASCAAVRDMDQRDAAARIKTPTLVIAGAHDVATPPADGRYIADRIAGARYVELPAAHLSNVWRSEESSMDERDRYTKGMEVRRAVLGDAHVDRTLAKRDPFTEEFQDLITRYAWGEIWTRPGLPRHTRSLITVALMIALNRTDEFKLHVRAAFNNGVTRDEIKEVIMHCAIYAGVPAANSAFHMAEDVFAQMAQAK
jgi:3-oxoadipate enol-lactonase/4-carboxymuconolactone decarboxylase